MSNEQRYFINDGVIEKLPDGDARNDYLVKCKYTGTFLPQGKITKEEKERIEEMYEKGRAMAPAFDTLY